MLCALIHRSIIFEVPHHLVALRLPKGKAVANQIEISFNATGFNFTSACIEIPLQNNLIMIG